MYSRFEFPTAGCIKPRHG